MIGRYVLRADKKRTGPPDDPTLVVASWQDGQPDGFTLVTKRADKSKAFQIPIRHESLMKMATKLNANLNRNIN